MPTKPKKKWNAAVDFESNGPIGELAKKASADSKKGKAIGDALCTPGVNFEAALDKLLKGGDVTDDLSDTERAFCAGWAYAASLAYPIDPNDPDPGHTKRRNAILAHLQTGPSFFSEGDDEAEILNG